MGYKPPPNSFGEDKAQMHRMKKKYNSIMT